MPSTWKNTASSSAQDCGFFLYLSQLGKRIAKLAWTPLTGGAAKIREFDSSERLPTKYLHSSVTPPRTGTISVDHYLRRPFADAAERFGLCGAFLVFGALADAGLGAEAGGALGAVASWMDCRNWSSCLSTSTLAFLAVLCVALIVSPSKPHARRIRCAYAPSLSSTPLTFKKSLRLWNNSSCFIVFIILFKLLPLDYRDVPVTQLQD